MRLLSYSINGKASFGIASETGVINLTDKLTDVRDLSDLIEKDALSAAALFVTADVDHSYDDIIFERTMPRPGKIYCIGVNYGGRNAEYKDDSAEAPKPSVFVRFPASLTGHGQSLIRPPESPQLDYEGEIVVVIGKSGRRIPESEAINHIAGLSLGNEGTIRDWVRHAKFNVTQGKNWNSSGSMGPWMVTMDEIPDVTDLHITTHVNGEPRQDDNTSSMAYSLAYQIAYLSTFCELEAGDIIYSGTPTGAGARFDPPKYLVPGDIVEVAVPEIGTLRNPVADEIM